MGLSLLCYGAILAGLLLVYPKLAPPTASQSLADDSDTDSSDSRQIESFSDSDFMP